LVALLVAYLVEMKAFYWVALLVERWVCRWVDYLVDVMVAMMVAQLDNWLETQMAMN